MGCPEHGSIWFKLEQVQKATTRLAQEVKRSLCRRAGSKLSHFSLPLAKEPCVSCAGLPACCFHHVHTFLCRNHWLGWALSGDIPWVWSFRHFPSATEPYWGSFCSLEMITSITLSTDGDDKHWCKPYAYSLLHAASHFAPCPLFVCTKTGSKRLKDSKRHKTQCMDVWMERFKRFCEVKQDHKTLRVSFCSCRIKVTIQNTVTEVSLVPNPLCITVVLKSYLQRRTYTLLLQWGKQLLSIYTHLNEFYKCKSSSLRNPTSCPHISAILQSLAQTYNYLRLLLLDHGYDSFFSP